MHFSTGSKAPSWLPGAGLRFARRQQPPPRHHRRSLQRNRCRSTAADKHMRSPSSPYSVTQSPGSRESTTSNNLRWKQMRPSLIAQDTQIARFDPDNPIFLSGSQIGILCNSFSKSNGHFKMRSIFAIFITLLFASVSAKASTRPLSGNLPSSYQ